MSKIIKSQHCIEAHPCRLDPVDVDAFFVNSQEEDEMLDYSSETDAETATALEEVLETIFPPGEDRKVESDNYTGQNPENPEGEDTELNGLAAGVPEIDLFKMNREAERLIAQSKQEAGALADLAREKAESITGTAKEEAAGIMGRAEEEALRIKEQASLDAEGIIEQAREQADETIAQAEQEAENIINQARLQAEGLKAEAHRQGLTEGRQEGLAKAKQETEANLVNSLNILSQAEEERVQRIASSEMELLKLVAGITEKIIGSELKNHPEQIVSIVKEALSRVATANSITVKINPEDLQMIRENLPVLHDVFNEPKIITVKEDQTILPGDCFIETEHGKVDARIKSQLERIMNEIVKAGQVNEPG